MKDDKNITHGDLLPGDLIISKRHDLSAVTEVLLIIQTKKRGGQDIVSVTCFDTTMWTHLSSTVLFTFSNSSLERVFNSEYYTDTVIIHHDGRKSTP